ncbi:uncharacterized protein [Procambarus clarkii]|uniref:uncharacterized protein n=1 Tax=Procambarus clarkii TaxID=6728 RepID=UPI001E670537|nr:uncharacterized protein LOC123771668 isoform X1 [Procambarus clarkii]
MASKKRSLSDDYSIASVAKRRHFPLTIAEKVEILKRKYAGFPMKTIREKFNVSVTTVYDIKRQEDKILKTYAESDYITIHDKKLMKLAKNMCKEMKAKALKHPVNSETYKYFNNVTENGLFLSFCEDNYAPTHKPTEETRLDFLWSESEYESDTECDSESNSESDCDESQEKTSMDEGMQPFNISIIEGIQASGNISLNEGIRLGKCYISFLEERSFMTSNNFKSINRIQKKLRKEISMNAGIQSQENISNNEEIQPQAGISTYEGIQSRENIPDLPIMPNNEEIQPLAGISLNEEIQSQMNISINKEIQPQPDISMYEGIQLGKCYIRFLKQRSSITQEDITKMSKILDKQIKQWPKNIQQATILDFFKQVSKK